MNATLADLPASEIALHESSNTFKSFDGVELFYRSWLPAGAARRAVVLLHRGHEHSGRWEQTVHAIAAPDTAYFAWDARGHGRSPGERGYADNFADVIRDLDCFVRHLSRSNHIALSEFGVIAHSVAAVTAAAWVHDYAPPIRAMVLATPAFRVKLYVPLAIPALRLRNKIGKAFVKSYVKPGMITRDAAEAEKYEQDELISRNIAVNILLDLFDTSTRLLDDAAAIRTPTLILSAGTDWVVKNSAQQRFFDRLASPIKQLAKFDHARHAIFHDTDRQQVCAKVKSFLDETFARPAQDDSVMVDAHQHGFTADEANRLRKPLPALSPRRFSFALQRLTMRTMGNLSEGIRLGWQTGFDSGESLDYVYENRPRGITPIGRMIDRSYLEAIGWRGIRIRKQNIESLLRGEIDHRLAAGEGVRLFDIAAGAGRYTLDVLKDYADRDVSALLRDRSAGALAIGRANAKRMGIANVNLAEGDAFDRNSLAAVNPRPNIAMVSGLYELFGDNEMVLRSLRGVADALLPGGTLIYTGQPWHPQVEMIARVLINRDGQPWIMRRRTQLEMDQLIRAAGFEKVDTRVDQWGIFTVSIAKKTDRPLPARRDGDGWSA
jgi:alpha-beta hydrolase superfamily lysophospholipase/SAM-dependent methyltransferase